MDTNGDDGNDGLDSANAWISIDNGDTKGILQPGDTVNIFPGTYSIASSAQLTTSGTSTAPIVYRRCEDSEVIVDANNGGFIILQINANRVKIQDLSFTRSSNYGIAVNGDSCSVTGCSVYDIDNSAISIAGSYNLIQKCRISNIQNHALLNGPTGHYNRYYGNTIYGAMIGVNMGPVQTARIFNNIIMSVTTGVEGGAGNACGFNDIWNFSSSDYAGGTGDSAGSIMDDPLFADASGNNFYLLDGSPCIDAGLDLGYPYLGSAPEMGALEFVPDDSGKAIWHSGTSTIPRWSIWDGSAFGPADNTVDIGDFRIMAGAEAPHRDEAMIIGVDQSSQISAILWDGFSWNDLPCNPLSTVSESSCWGFDVAYMSLNGDGVMVWNNGVTGPNGLSYCTFNGDSLFGIDTISSPITGEPKHMHLAANPNSNELVLAVSNHNSQDYALVWDSASWGHSMVLCPVVSVDNRTDVCVTYEQKSGRAMVVYGRGTTNICYRIWNGTNWSVADSLIKPADADGDVAWAVLASDPGSNHIVMGILTENQDIWLSVWNGISWEPPQTVTNSAIGTTFPAVAVAFESQSGEALTAYGEAASVRYRTWNDSDGWSAEGTAANIGASPNSLALDAAPNSDKVMLSVQDGNSDLNCVLWDGAAWQTTYELETNTGETENMPFIFLWNVMRPVNQQPVLASIGPRSVTENSNLNFVVSADDIESTPAMTTSSLPGGANFVDNGNGTGTFDWTPMYPSAGDYEVTFYATDDSAAVDSEVVTITVNEAVLDHIIIEPDSAVVSADSTLQYSITGYDADSNEANPGVITWDLTIALGTIDSTGLFDAVTTGTGQVIAVSDKGPVDTSAYLEVIPGKLDSLYIIPNRDTISADSTRQFTALGFDAEGNANADLGTLDWDVEQDIGSIDSTGLFDAGRAGHSFIKVSSNLSRMTKTDTIFVVAGEIVNININPDSNIVEIGNSFQYTAIGYDSDSNIAADISELVTWSTDDSTGSIDSTGLYTAGNIINKYYVMAAYSTLTDSATVNVIGAGGLSYIRIELEDGTHFINDTSLSTDNDTTVLHCRAYGLDDEMLGSIAVDWFILGTDSIGTVTEEASDYTTLVLTTPGTGRVAVEHGSGLVDTTGTITCNPGLPVEIVITPDTATISADSTLLFTAASFDADGNPSEPAIVPRWSVLNGIGSIDSISGLFDATTVGNGYVIADGDSLADTTGIITVIPGALDHIIISPDTASVGMGDSIQFVADGYDADSNITDAGVLSWKALGRSGTIDGTGLYVASRPGRSKIAVTSSINALVDTTGYIDVEELYLTTISLGSNFGHPMQSDIAVLAFRIENYFDVDKSIEGISVRDNSSGGGSPAEIMSNIDSIHLYYDIDNDSMLTGMDSLIAEAEYNTGLISLAFSPITIMSYTGKTFFAGAKISQYPCDGDSTDVMIIPASDIAVTDSTVVAGPDTANSLGYTVIDGMVSGQIAMSGIGQTEVYPGDTIYNVMSFKIPRNGYLEDYLNILSVVNEGDAGEDDIDSLILYHDNGDNVWNKPDELCLGSLTYTGDHWVISGLQVPLTQTLNQFYIGADIAEYPYNNATIALAIPQNGISVLSQNDGPLDGQTTPNDTVTIKSTEKLTVVTNPLKSAHLIPGEMSGAILSLKIINSCNSERNVDSLKLALAAFDPDGATQIQLDSQIDSLLLFLDRDGDYENIGAGDSLIAVATVADGSALFDIGGLGLLANGTVANFIFATALNAENSKNGNSINLVLTGSTDLYLAQPTTIQGDFPLSNDDDFIIDAFPAQNVTVNELPGDLIIGGETNQPIMDFILPSNGYAADMLKSLQIENIDPSGLQKADLSLKLWLDNDNNGYDIDDNIMGIFNLVDNTWRLNKIDLEMNPGGERLIITIDVTNTHFNGGTFRPAMPIGSVVYKSGMIGPDDEVVSNAASHLIMPPDRIFAFADQENSVSIMPGSVNNELLTFALYNGYIDKDQLFSSLIITNETMFQADQTYADYEIGQISLFYDKNKNKIFDQDSLLAAGFFSEGKLNLTGLNLTIPVDSQAYFFLISEIPLDVIDGESLSVAVEIPSDLGFEGNVNINGDFPLSSGGYHIVDGSIGGQYEVLSLPAKTIFPGDTSVAMFALKPAFNGDLADTLEQLMIKNVLDADLSDISALELWLDINQDQSWQSTDSLIVTMQYDDSIWMADSLQVEIDRSTPALFIIGDISETATNDRSFQGQIPVNGCQYKSANDGPIDGALTSEETYIISNSNLAVSIGNLNEAYSTGQTITVALNVTNLNASTVNDITGEIVLISDSSLVVLDSSFSGPVSLNTGESVDFKFYFSAVLTGEIHWRLRAVSSELPLPSPTVQTETVTIQTPPINVMVQMITTIPASVTRGQTNVFPFSLILNQPDTTSTISTVVIDSLGLSVEDGSGSPLPANQALSGFVLSSGYNILAVIDSVPAQSDITFDFDEPIFIEPGQQRQFVLLVDIDSQAVADNFALSITAPEDIPLLDMNTLEIIPIDSTVNFPLRTPSCRIDEKSQVMAVSYESLIGSTVNYGQDNVDVLKLRLHHPGDIGSSQIKLTNLSLYGADDFGDSVCMNELLENISIIRQQVVIAEAMNFDSGQSMIDIPLNSPVTLNPLELDSITLRINLIEDVSCGKFALIVPDSTCLVVRDLSSGQPLPATGDISFATGNTFPMASDIAMLINSAVNPYACLTSVAPASVVSGTDTVALADFNISYPVSSEYSSMYFKDIAAVVVDSAGTPLDPFRLFDRIGYSISGQPVDYQPVIKVVNGRVIFELGTDGMIINSGDSTTVTLTADIEADAVYDNFVLIVESEDAFDIIDANDSTNEPGLLPGISCDLTFPFMTGAVNIFSAAGKPVISFEKRRVVLAGPGQNGVAILSAEMSYFSNESVGNILLKEICGRLYKRENSSVTAVTGSEVFERIELYVGGELLAVDSVLASDSLKLLPDENMVITNGDELTLEIIGNLTNDALLGNYIIMLEDSGFVGLEDQDLGMAIYPIVSGSYPLESNEISIAAAALENSFTNYPNPFNPSKGEYTTIGYILTDDANVTIEVFTITGQSVRQIADGRFRAAGAYQDDVWLGLNDAGLEVLPGTYFCEIKVKYSSGREEILRRKIALIR